MLKSTPKMSASPVRSFILFSTYLYRMFFINELLVRVRKIYKIMHRNVLIDCWSIMKEFLFNSSELAHIDQKSMNIFLVRAEEDAALYCPDSSVGRALGF